MMPVHQYCRLGRGLQGMGLRGSSRQRKAGYIGKHQERMNFEFIENGLLDRVQLQHAPLPMKTVR